MWPSGRQERVGRRLMRCSPLQAQLPGKRPEGGAPRPGLVGVHRRSAVYLLLLHYCLLAKGPLRGEGP